VNRESEILQNKVHTKHETDDYRKNQGNSHKVPPAHAQRVLRKTNLAKIFSEARSGMIAHKNKKRIAAGTQ